MSAGLKKGLQALFNQSEFEAFDLCGRRVVLSEPIDVQAAVGNKNTYANRRVIRNGQLTADAGAAWDDEVTHPQRHLVRLGPRELSNVSNAGRYPDRRAGHRATGRRARGLCRRQERGAGQADAVRTRSGGRRPARPTPSRRFKYMLDFSGFQNLQRFVVSDIEFLCAGFASGLMLPLDGLVFQIQDCFFTGPKDRGITSAGEGCQGMQIDRCQFLSNEQQLTCRIAPRSPSTPMLGREGARQPGGEVPAFRRHGRSGQHPVGQPFLPGRQRDQRSALRRPDPDANQRRRFDGQLHRQLLRRMGQRA
jgi:hypothetical protein